MANVAADAEKYKGKPYKWAGSSPSGWDCSGFVNYVLGHDLGMTLPGGAHWKAGVHGPVAAQYRTYGSASKSPAAGDLVVWLTHVGIAVSSDHMISALDPSYGTAITPIKGFGPVGEPMVVRSVGSTGGGSSGTGSTGSSGGGSGATASGATTTAAKGCPVTLLMLPFLIPYHLIRRKKS